MKLRNYERKGWIIIGIMVLFLIEIVGGVFLYQRKENEYIKISSIFVKNNTVLVVVTKEERKVLYHNKTLYIEDKKTNYEIEEDRGIVLKQKQEKYYELILKVNTPKEKKANDLLEISISKEKKNIWDLIRNTWEDDKK